ncbi:MAG TPA: DegV family protein [Anaerolineales bacterium]|nr:DegV family protein [Anaerolineales bacterium]
MPPIAVITDTDSSLPLDLAKKYGIVEVPITIQFGEESFRDVYDIDNAAVFARIDREGRLPRTAAPSPGQFVEAYQAAFEAGADQILCLTISSEMSAVYTAACRAAELFPGRTIQVVDSRTVSFGEGLMAIEAAKAIAEGGSMDEAVAAAVKIRARTHLFGALSTLRYLAMSGRVGHVAAGFGSLLEIKPILTLRNEKLEMLERIRTQGKAWARVIELAVEAAGGDAVEQMAILHINVPAAAGQFEQQVRAALPCPAEIPHVEMMPGLSIHTGAGLVGVVLVTKA